MASKHPAGKGQDSRSAQDRKGGATPDNTQRAASSGRGKHNNPGNFANDRDKAREAGRKGGQS